MEKIRKALEARIANYDKDIKNFKKYDTKKTNKHNSDLMKADILLEYVTSGYKRCLDTLDKVLDNAVMQQEFDITAQLKTFKDMDQAKQINSILSYFEEKYSVRKNSMFLNLRKRYGVFYCCEHG